MLQGAYEALLDQVHKYAAELERLDPDAYSATHVLAAIALALSCAETTQSRLDILNVEAHHMKRVLAEIRYRRTLRAKLITGIEKSAPFVEAAIGALVWPLVALSVVLILVKEGIL